MKVCKKCGQEIEDKAVVCVHCGCSVKTKKPIFKKWWFWVVIVVVIIAIAAGSSGDGESNTNTDTSGTDTSTNQPADNKEEQISYEVVDLQTMIDDLESNAIRAEQNYQNKYVEVTGRIANFDSDGKYISIDPVGSEFNFTSVMCYIKSEDQKSIILNKSKGDTVTIKGKVKSIGEVLGYSIDIKEIA